MKKYLAPACGYSVEGRHICADGSVVKKISGTMMGGILGVSPWATPFTVSCDLFGLAREDISDKPAVKTGIALEATIIQYADRTFTNIGQFIPAENIFEKRKGDHDSWVSDFDDDDFAGHVDGIVIDKDGNDFILEVKTSSNIASWENGVPEYYFWQVALYNEFVTKKDKAYVVLGMVDEKTHQNPASWVPNERTVALFEVSIDRKEVQSAIENIRAWYHERLQEFKTTDFSPESDADVEMITHLMMLKETIDNTKKKMNSTGELLRFLDANTQDIKDKSVEYESMKNDIKSYMEYNDTTEIVSEDGKCMAKMSVQNRTVWDEDMMKCDGIDPAKYKKRTLTNVLKIKSLEK
jgi:hypothetical protein